MSTPEKRLLLAVLARALEDACGNGRHGARKNTREEANEWVESDSIKKWSFLWICEHVDLDPVLVRNELVKRLDGTWTPAPKRDWRMYESIRFEWPYELKL